MLPVKNKVNIIIINSEKQLNASNKPTIDNIPKNNAPIVFNTHNITSIVFFITDIYLELKVLLVLIIFLKFLLTICNYLNNK